MENITTLSDCLQKAIASGDASAISAATKNISLLVKHQEDKEKDIARTLRAKQQEKECTQVAKKFPCTACGGKLKWAPLGPAECSYRFECIKCNRPCGRVAELKKESETQAILKNKIDSFKTLLRKIIEIGQLNVSHNDDFTIVNGQPFSVFARNGYALVLACSYKNHYAHESLKPEENWDCDIEDAMNAAFGCHLFGDFENFSWDASEKLRRLILNLPLDQRFIRRTT